MLGLGSNISKTGKLGVHDLGIVTSNLVLKHNYDLSSVQPLSSGAASFVASGNDAISMGDQDNLSFGTGSFSTSCWVNSTQTGASRFVLTKKAGDGGGDVGYGLYLGNGGTDWVFGVSDGTDTLYTTTTVDQNVNQWYHLCGTFDGVAKTARLYVDGVLIATGTDTDVGDTDTTQPFQIGKAGASTSTDWDGYICNVGVWNATLSQAQIKSIMNKNYAGLSDSEKTDLVSWWNLDSVIPDTTSVYDNHYGGEETLGADKVTDGTFINGLDSWSASGPTESGGVVRFSGGTDNIFQSLAYTDNKVYAIALEGTGDAKVRVGYSGLAATQTVVGTLPATLNLFVDSTANRIQVYKNSGDELLLTSVSVKEINGNTGTLS